MNIKRLALLARYYRFLAFEYLRVFGRNRFCLEGIHLDAGLASEALIAVLGSGEYEAAERDLLKEMLTPGDSVLEIGSAIGFLSCLAAKLGARPVACVEAQPSSLRLLRKNLRRNGVAARVIAAAWAPRTEPIRWRVAPHFTSSRIAAADEGSSLTVRGLSLPDIIAEAGFAPVCLIVDIEGSEADFDFSEVPVSTTKLVIEVHSQMLGEPGVRRVLDNIARAGFRQERRIADCYAFVRQP